MPEPVRIKGHTDDRRLGVMGPKVLLFGGGVSRRVVRHAAG
jgi:hypothetical protein